MTIRPFKLPEDIGLMNSLVMEGFQYPHRMGLRFQSSVLTAPL